MMCILRGVSKFFFNFFLTNRLLSPRAHYVLKPCLRLENRNKPGVGLPRRSTGYNGEQSAWCVEALWLAGYGVRYMTGAVI